MGTETLEKIQGLNNTQYAVKLNNPQMGTETI